MKTKFSADHQRIVCEYYGWGTIPKGIHIHHRDLNKENNDVTNLTLMTGTDHSWIHDEAGKVGFFMLNQGAITIEQLAIYTSDPEKFIHFMTSNLTNQDPVDFLAYLDLFL